MEIEEIYGRIGEEGFERLVHAFYAQVPDDDILGPMYPKHDLAGAEVRLRDFLIGRCGGPPRYVEQRGHPRLRMRHGPFAVTPFLRDRWLTHMRDAIDSLDLSADQAHELWTYMERAAHSMVNTFEDDPVIRPGLQLRPPERH
jgi:hemoglobin